MKKLALAICLISNAAFAEQPYNYNLSNQSPFGAMMNGVNQYQAVKIKDAQVKEISNVKPTYGKSGLPSNCRAYIQYAINSYRQGEYSVDDTMTAMERNCGINGWLWEDN